MTITRAQMDAEIDVQMPDNTSNLITPSVQRGVLHDMVGFTAQPSSFITTQIPSTLIGSPATFTVIGYSTAGDLGQGATYTSVGAGPTSIGAIQDSGGTWFRLVLTNGVASIGWFGCKGDGVTDDSAGFLSAITAVTGGPNAIYIPPVANHFLINSLITYNANTYGALSIDGEGRDSSLKFMNNSGGLLITGTYPTNSGVTLRNFEVETTNASSAYGIQLSGIAVWDMANIEIFGFVKGLYLHGTQQGRFNRGFLGNQTSIYIDDQGSSSFASNGNSFLALSFDDDVTAINVQGANAANWFSNIHISGNYSSSRVIVNTTAAPNYFDTMHVEGFNGTGYCVDIQNGPVGISNCNFGATAPRACLHVSGTSNVVSTSNWFVGPSMVIDSGCTFISTSDNIFAIPTVNEQTAQFINLRGTPSITGTQNIQFQKGKPIAAPVQVPAYQISTPSSGGTVIIPDDNDTYIIVPAGTLATLTVQLPTASPLYDGKRVGFSTTQAITALTVTATSGTVVNQPGSLAAQQCVFYRCVGNQNKWFLSP